MAEGEGWLRAMGSLAVHLREGKEAGVRLAIEEAQLAADALGNARVHLPRGMSRGGEVGGGNGGGKGGGKGGE